jgi:hypothetical protein
MASLNVLGESFCGTVSVSPDEKQARSLVYLLKFIEDSDETALVLVRGEGANMDDEYRIKWHAELTPDSSFFARRIKLTQIDPAIKNRASLIRSPISAPCRLHGTFADGCKRSGVSVNPALHEPALNPTDDGRRLSISRTPEVGDPRWNSHLSGKPKQVPRKIVDVRVNYFAIDVPKQSSKTSAETGFRQTAGVNTTSQAHYLVVQSPTAAGQRSKVELELVQCSLAEEVDGAQFGTTAIHSSEDMKDSVLVLAQLCGIDKSDCGGTVRPVSFTQAHSC